MYLPFSLDIYIVVRVESKSALKMANLEYSSCSCALHELTLVASNHQTLTESDLVDFPFFPAARFDA